MAEETDPDDVSNNGGVLEGQAVDEDEVLEGQPVEPVEDDEDAVIDGMPVDETIKKDETTKKDDTEKPALGETAPLLPPLEKESDNHHIGRRCHRFSACLAYTGLFLVLSLDFWWVPYGMGVLQHEHLWTLWFPLGLLTSVVLPFCMWMHCITGCAKCKHHKLISFETKLEQRSFKYGLSCFTIMLTVFIAAFGIGVLMQFTTEEALRVFFGEHDSAVCPSISPATIPEVTTALWATGGYVYDGHTGWVHDKGTCIVLAPVLAPTQQNSTGCSAVLGHNGETTVRFWAYHAKASSSNDCSHMSVGQIKKGAIIKAADEVSALNEHAVEEWDNLKSVLDSAKSNFFTTGGSAARFVDGGHSRYVELTDTPEEDSASGSFWPIFMFFAVPLFMLLVVLGLYQLYQRDPKCCCFQHLGFLVDDVSHFDISTQQFHETCC